MSLFEAITGMIKNAISDDDPNAPLHVGEVMSLWTYHAFIQVAKMYIQIALNTTTDEELRNGVQVPPSSEEKPLSDSTAIPLGVKLTDYEIANGLAVKSTSAMVMCASSAAQSVRNDVGLMFIEMQSEMLVSAYIHKNLMRKRG